MKFQPYVEKLEQSPKYKEFILQYPKAFVVAGFFILDLEEGKNVHQIDFYIPSEKKIAAFTLDGEVTLQILDMMDSSKVPQQLDLSVSTDLDALQGILTDEMRNRGMSENIRKIIAVIQNVDGKKVWNLNCVLTGMEILKSHVEDESQTVLKIERASILEVMKKLTPPQMMKAPAAQKEDVAEELKKLDQIESQIEKAKEQLKKELDAKKTK